MTQAVTKGRITNTLTQVSKEFMFNPPHISDDKHINWGTLDVPGASHPVYQFGSGGERLISFELYLDGDMYRKDRKVNSGSFDPEFPNGRTLDVSGHVAFYRSLVHPTDYTSKSSGGFTPFQRVSPPTLILTIGKLYTRLNVICKGGVPVEYSYFLPDMTPTRATLKLQFAEVVSRSQTAGDIFNNPGFSPSTDPRFI